ncbi:MAG: hypothetical protein O2955_08720 [Planctomycetota bacterium]|nr:hypothetical protein [Planctomycetota bacterium]MDA1212588.1 hypothetical protein [Planctomycetota bacterium]
MSAINACLVLASLISASIAQETPKAETTKAPPNVSTRKPDATPPQLNDDALPDPAMLSDVNSDIVYIPGADGRYIKILVSTKLNEFLNWLKTNGGTNVETQPAFGITSLKISGSANDEHASLKIIVTLQLTVDEPVRVPLNLREAVIQNVTYRGEGREAIPDRFAEGAAARQAGYVWWFQGKGTHELELDVLVPVVTQSPTRRMQLTLPNTAVGSMVLAVPFDRFQVKLPEDSTSLVKTNFRDETNASRIELVGLDSRLDISWQPAPETQPVDLVLQSAFSPIDLDFTGETVLLSATQKVGALQGTFDNFTVTLPPDFKPLDVEGPSYRKREFVENDESRVTISLKEPTKGPIEIKWTLEAPFPSKGIPFAVEGFQVEHAQRQTGEIQIRSPDGYRIHRREGEDRFIHRINVSDSGVVDRVSSAYRFLKQPFRLVLDVQKEEPYYSVTPELLAHVTEGHIDLMCRFRFQVFRGAVSNVVIRWPLAVNEGWAIDPVQTPGLIESVTMTEEETGDGASSESRWQLKFVAPKSGDFEITLNARRPIQSDGSRLPCHLPMAEASSSAPTILAWILAENVESDLKPIGTTTLRPVPTTLAARVNVPAEWMSLRQFLWRIDSAEQVLEAGVKKYAQRIEAESDIEATIGEKEIKVRQRLDYDVSYERVSVLRMTVSSDLVPRPKFYLDEKPISTVWNEEGNTTVVSARLELPEPRLKHFEVVAEYSVPIPLTTEDEEKAEIQLPIVQSSDAAFKSTRILFQQQSLWEVDVSDQGWQSEVATEDALVYRSTKPQAYVPLTIREYLGERQRTLTISRAVIRTQFVPDGQTMTRAQYRIQGSGREIGIALPMELELVNAYINQNTIVLDGTEVTAEQTINYRIPLTGNIDLSKSGSVILTMDIRSKSVANFDWLDRQKIVLPEVVDELLIQQTIFEVILPGGQHLADNPNGLLPQFSWQLTLHGGMRRPLRDWSNPDDWIGSTNDVPPPLDGFDAGNGYVFSRFGAIESVTIHTLHRSLLVLFGAGLSLLASAVWLNVARVRHPYSMVVMVLIASLVGIWHESIVILLLQPFFGGLLLAFLAFAIDRRYRRETAPAVVTLGSTNEYMVPISSAFRSIPDQPSASAIKSIDRQVGSEDPTTLRPAHSGSPRDSVSVAE